MKTKNYEAPETEVVVVRIERQIMSPGVQTSGLKGNGYGATMYYLDDDDE